MTLSATLMMSPGWWNGRTFLLAASIAGGMQAAFLGLVRLEVLRRYSGGLWIAGGVLLHGRMGSISEPFCYTSTRRSETLCYFEPIRQRCHRRDSCQGLLPPTPSRLWPPGKNFCLNWWPSRHLVRDLHVGTAATQRLGKREVLHSCLCNYYYE